MKWENVKIKQLLHRHRLLKETYSYDWSLIKTLWYVFIKNSHELCSIADKGLVFSIILAKKTDETLYIKSIYLSKDFQNNAELVHYFNILFNQYNNLKLKYVWLKIKPDNTKAIDFFTEVLDFEIDDYEVLKEFMTKDVITYNEKLLTRELDII